MNMLKPVKAPMREKGPALVHEGLVVDEYIREGRFQISFSLLTAVSGLLTGLEISYEHLRGSYGQRIMYTPVILGLALFIAGVWGAFNAWAARVILRIVSFLTLLDGLVGFYYHIRGIQRKPGGWRLPIVNIMMGPPISAPLLFSSIGILGVIASWLRRETTPRTAITATATKGTSISRPMHRLSLPRQAIREGERLEQQIREGRFQQLLAILTAVSTFLSGIEALYSHYQNNFSYRVQWTPILLTPMLMIAGIGTIWSRTCARILLPLTSMLAIINGMVGFLYHARGIRRQAGGLKKPFYNMLYGPPILAPLMFAASGCIGLLASLLRRAKA
ncbi:MAG TPA: hypothetical protein VL461_04185 [Dictyobacter sp.]|jgi:hypothetical protein|nr:hypothetical protein [Dictyobacter sp.]